MQLVAVQVHVLLLVFLLYWVCVHVRVCVCVVLCSVVPCEKLFLLSMGSLYNDETNMKVCCKGCMYVVANKSPTLICLRKKCFKCYCIITVLLTPLSSC